MTSYLIHHPITVFIMQVIPEYIDKNLGGILIIYDRLFGTYAKEIIPPVYGITHNIYTHNPRKVLLHEYKNVFSEVSKIKGLKNKIRLLFSKPGATNNFFKQG